MKYFIIHTINIKKVDPTREEVLKQGILKFTMDIFVYRWYAIGYMRNN